MKNKLLFIIFFCIFQMTNAATELPTALNTITVTSTNDDGSDGTLRWAINSANADPSITQIDFTSGLSGTLLLTNDLPSISTDITIIGSGSNNFTISGNTLYTMFNVDSGKTLTISHLAFTYCKSSDASIFNTNNSNIIASNILVQDNNSGSAIGSFGNSTITISDSVFINNSPVSIFISDYGSTPTITSSILTNYTNRITVTNTTFENNGGLIFSTERYVKIDQCTFINNTGQIGAFYGVNRYQILNSTFTGNTNDNLLVFGNSWIGDGSLFGEFTLGADNTLVDGNTFIDNPGLVIEPGGSSYYDAKTTITNNVFTNNGTNWSGNPSLTPAVNCNQTTSSNSLKLSNGSTLAANLSSQSNWTISGGADQALFSIASNHILNFSSPANYDSNASNSYLVNVTNGCHTINYTITISPLCGTW
jgi:hypothetical protein